MTMPATASSTDSQPRTFRSVFPILAGLLILQAGCMRTPLVEYSTDTPPLVRLPAEQSDVVDGRARFREMYCTFERVYGRSIPFNRPCAEALMSLDDEPASADDFAC